MSPQETKAGCAEAIAGNQTSAAMSSAAVSHSPCREGESQIYKWRTRVFRQDESVRVTEAGSDFACFPAIPAHPTAKEKCQAKKARGAILLKEIQVT